MRQIVVALLLLLLVPASAGAQGKAPVPGNEGRWIVVYERAAVADVDRETEARERRRGFRSRLRFRRAIEGFSASLTAQQVRALRADPDVQAVVPDRPVRAHAAQPLAPGEPLPPRGVRRIGAGTVDWVREQSDVGVAVLDSGVDLDHPDLNVADGIDCVTPGTTADDDDGHGSHVAGTIGGRNNGTGVTGVAPGTRVHAVKVLNSAGSGSTSQVVCGLDWVVANAAARNIRVLNMSLGTLGDNNRNCGRQTADPASPLVDPLHAAICRATAAGLLTVVAAGNGDPDTGIGWNISENPPDVPATYPEVLTVSAIADADGAPGGLGVPSPSCSGGSTTDDAPARFSNFTTAPAEAVHMIAAPGTCITSTWKDGAYATIAGTSMAAPHVAAAAALCIGEAGASGPCAGMSPAQIVERLRADAFAYRAANPGYGFTGDTSSPPDPVYGPLLRPVVNGPQTAFTVTPPDTTGDSTPSFEFASPTPNVRFECSVDGDAFVVCGSPFTTAELPDGPHQVSVRATDMAGNVDGSPAVDSFVVDAVPDPPPPPPPPPLPPADVRAPAVSYSMASRQRIATVSRKGMRVSVSCDEPCRLAASVVYGSTTAGRKNAGLAGGRRLVTIKLTSAVRRRLARTRSALVRVRILATDAAGNVRSVSKSVRLTR